MDTARYILALILVISLPVSLLLWFAIHPFARYWRHVGAAGTYAILALPSLALMWAVWRARAWLLAVEFGTSWPLIGIGAILLVAAGTMARKRMRLLTFGILSGIPELSEAAYPGRLLTEGIYGRIRHPRYVEITAWVLAYALISNYLAAYLAWALMLPTLHAIVILEERELRERFGAAYEAYCARVPRYVPRRRGASA